MCCSQGSQSLIMWRKSINWIELNWIEVDKFVVQRAVSHFQKQLTVYGLLKKDSWLEWLNFYMPTDTETGIWSHTDTSELPVVVGYGTNNMVSDWYGKVGFEPVTFQLIAQRAITTGTGITQAHKDTCISFLSKVDPLALKGQYGWLVGWFGFCFTPTDTGRLVTLYWHQRTSWW
jgi:hypothetical protein